LHVHFLPVFVTFPFYPRTCLLGHTQLFFLIAQFTLFSMERQRKAQARHLALLSSDAPVMNRCAKEEAHLQQRLAQSTAAFTRGARQNQAAAEREERAREAHLQAQLAAVLSKTPGIRVPSLATSNEPITADGGPANGKVRKEAILRILAAPAAEHRHEATPATMTETPVAPLASASGPSPACLLGFPEPYETSGFKSAVHWASVAFDETFLTAYGPRRLREEMQAKTVAEAGGHASARDTRPHRLMVAVACYLLNEVLCADATVASLWQEKLRQPIFDAVFSSQSIAAGQEKRRAYQSIGKPGNEAARLQVILQQTLGAAAPTTAEVSKTPAAEEKGLSTSTSLFSPASAELQFPPRTNVYATRDDFASMRLWTEEVAAEQREKAVVCRRVRALQDLITRRMQLLHIYQKQTNEATLRSLFTVWRTHARQCRAHRAATERYLENRHRRVLEESVFLRWRRVTLQTKVESLQRRMLNIVAEREEAARQHAADLALAQEQLASERRRHQQATYEQDVLRTQILESHSMEVEALQLALHQQRAQTAEVGKWAKRWERLAKTFRPAQLCLVVPPSVWTHAHALYGFEETMAATVLGKGGDHRVLQQMPYSMVLPVRERLERLLLAWVNSVMEKSPLASSWVPLETFLHGRAAHPRSILVSQLPETSAANRTSNSAGATTATVDPRMTEFNVYTLMVFIRELRRLYILAGKMPDPDITDARLSHNGGGWGGGRTSLAKYFREVVQLLSVQTCAGLYPSLLSHCPSLPRWFSPEGVFGGPAKSFEGAGKERRLQHTMFVWLLTTLLIGHIRITMLAPAGEKDDGLPPPASSAVSLRCSREADLDSTPQVNFPVDPFASSTTATAGPPGRKGDPNMPTSAGVMSVHSRGSSVASQNTFLSKKAPNSASNRASAIVSGLDNGKRHLSRGGVRNSATAREAAGDTARLQRDSVTLEMALREHSQQVGATLTGAEDSLSDIESYLGLLSTQGQSLRKPETQRARSAATSAGTAAGINENNKSSTDRDDDFADGLLQQLVEARDAAAQSRRLRRMQHKTEGTNGERGNDDDTGVPFSNLSNENSDDGSDVGAQDLDGCPQSGTVRLVEGRTATVLTEGQLRILRSLPARSCAFDTMRPAPSFAKESLSKDAPGTTAATPTASTQAQAEVPSAGDPSGKFYSFLLNMLEDATRRQQWAGLARVITSLVVRFHVLDDAEDGVQRSNMMVANREAPSKEGAGLSRPSSPRRPLSGSLMQSFGGTSARPPAVLSTTAREAAGTAAAVAVTPKEKKAATTTAVNGSPSSARGKSRGRRVPARLVPSRPSPASQPVPASGEERPSLSGNSAIPASLRVKVMTSSEAMICTMPADTCESPAQGSASLTTSATVPQPQKSKGKAAPLLSAHEMRVLRGEMSKRVQHTAHRGKASASNSQRASALVDSVPQPPASKPSSANTEVDRKTEELRLPSALPQHHQEEERQPQCTAASPKALPPQNAAPHVGGSGTPPSPADWRDRCGDNGIEAGRCHPGIRPKSTNLSIMSTPRGAALETPPEQVIVCVEKRSSVTSALSDTELPGASPPAPPITPEALPTPPTTMTPEDAVQPLAVQTGNELSLPVAPATASSAAASQTLRPPVPPQSFSPKQQGTPFMSTTSSAPRAPALPSPPPPVTPPCETEFVGRRGVGVGEGGQVEEDEGGAPLEQLGFLDPLVEHGASQSCAAAEKIRKYRFHLQP
jgi:hypothetical protein